MDPQKVTLAARIDEGEYEAPKSSPRTDDVPVTHQVDCQPPAWVATQATSGGPMNCQPHSQIFMPRKFNVITRTMKAAHR